MSSAPTRVLTVLLEEDVSDEGYEKIVTALQMTRGVQEVIQGEPVDCMTLWTAKSDLRRELFDTMLQILGTKKKKIVTVVE